MSWPTREQSAELSKLYQNGVLVGGAFAFGVLKDPPPVAEGWRWDFDERRAAFLYDPQGREHWVSVDEAGAPTGIVCTDKRGDKQAARGLLPFPHPTKEKSE